MENDTRLGQPIPTGIITATEIVSTTAPDTAAVTADAKMSIEPSAFAIPSSVMAELLVAPILFWASLSTAYLRFFEFSDRDRRPTYTIG